MRINEEEVEIVKDFTYRLKKAKGGNAMKKSRVFKYKKNKI